MASISWKNDADGLWSTAANWSTGVLPGAGDQVTISLADPHTVTHASGADTISTLYTNGNATLALTGGSIAVTGNSTLYGNVSQSAGTLALGPDSYIGGTYTQTAGTLKISTGVLRIDGTGNSFGGTIAGAGVNFESGSDVLATGSAITAAQLQITGATVTLGHNMAYTGAFGITSGTLALGANTLTLSGPTALDGGATTGTGTIALAGSTTDAGFYLTGSTALVNTGTLTDSNFLYVGYYGADTATLQNNAGATFKLIANADIYGTANAAVTNAGTLTKAGGGGQSLDNVNTASTGLVAVNSGTLAFSGASDSFAGSITGAGDVAFTGGTDMLANGLAATSGGLTIAGATVTEGGNMAYAGKWTQTSGTLSLGGHTLTETGAVVLDGGYVLGSGSMVLNGTTEFAGSYLSGSVKLVNAGTATQTATFYDGYQGADTTVITNNAGATYDIAGNLGLYGATSAGFANNGTLVKSGGSGIAIIGVSYTGAKTSTVAINQGTLRFSGPSSTLAGTFTGTGTMELNTGADKLTSATIGVGQLLVDGATVTLGANATYTAGEYTQTGGTLALGGHALTLTAANLDGGVVSGAGTLAVSKAINLGGTAIEGSAILQNGTGTLTVSSTSYIGYNSSDTAELLNKAAGFVSLIDNASLYANAASTVVNAGNLVKTSGGGISLIQGGLTNTGTITVKTGTLRLTGTSSLGGVLAGPGTLELNGGADTLNATAVTVGELLLDGANVTLGANTSYAGAFDQTYGTLALGGKTLTLSGTGSFEGGASNGAGTIASSGNITAYSLAMEGSTVFSNTGTVTDTNVVYVGYNSSDTAQFVNAAGATFKLTTNAYVSTGGASTFSNAGTLIHSGTGSSNIYASFINTGIIVLQHGTLRLSGGSNTLGGTVSGAGTLELAGGAVALNLSAVSGGGLLLDGANVTLGANLSTAAAFSQTTGSLALGGHTLTLTGTTNLDGGNTTGSGTIAISGNTEAYNYYLEGSTQLTNSGSLTVAANTTLNVGYNSSDSATLSNLAGGHIELLGSARLGAGGAGVFNNAGSVLADGSGPKYIYPATTNTGKIEVSQGALSFLGTVAGTGTFAVDSGTQLSFGAAVSGAGLVSMAANATLGVSTTAGFTDLIGGFTTGDLIDLNGFGFNTSSVPVLSFSASTDKLTVTEGSTSFTLAFSGTHAAADFVAVDDQGIIGIAHS